MIFKLLTALACTLAVQGSFLEKRTIEDGTGDATTPGAHLKWTYNGKFIHFFKSFFILIH
jgi:hypothetical protein